MVSVFLANSVLEAIEEVTEARPSSLRIRIFGLLAGVHLELIGHYHRRPAVKIDAVVPAGVIEWLGKLFASNSGMLSYLRRFLAGRAWLPS